MGHYLSVGCKIFSVDHMFCLKLKTYYEECQKYRIVDKNNIMNQHVHTSQLQQLSFYGQSHLILYLT